MLRLLNADGTPADAGREWVPMWVEACVPREAWEAAELRRDGQLMPLMLRKLDGAVRVVAEWPRSGPGNYELRLRAGAEECRQTVAVQPEKIGRDAFARLLEDLESRLPATIALAAQRAGGFAGVRFLAPKETTVAEELFRIERAIAGIAGRPGLAETLVEIARDPHQVLGTRELWVRRERARRPHPARLARALARGGNLAVDRRPVQVLDTRVEHSADVYENRVVRTFAGQVERRLRRVHRILESTQQATLEATARALTDRLTDARRRASFLDEIAELSHAPDRITMVLLNRPPYRAAFEGLLEFQRSISVRLEDDALDAPLENLPYLYQAWGALHVVEALIATAAELGYEVRRQRLVRIGPGGAFLRILPNGEPVVVLEHPLSGTVVRLIPERSYDRSGGLRSISYPQRPDVAVEIFPPHAPPRVYLFDPKYKLEGGALDEESASAKPKKVDIDKMHAYRDAIRDAEGRRVVRYAGILYPGSQHLFHQGIEALSAHPGNAASLQSRLNEVLRDALLVRPTSILTQAPASAS